MSNWVGLIHVIFSVLMSIYVFIFKKTVVDYLYLIFIYFLLLHWTFLNGECIFSYVIKKMKNKDYIAGKDTKKNEMAEVFAGKLYLKYIYRFILNVVWPITLYLILVRNKFNSFYSVTFVLLFLFYKCGVHYSRDHYKNIHFLIIQDITKYSLILYGFFFIPLLFKRFRLKRN